jgi:hypothetical protein
MDDWNIEIWNARFVALIIVCKTMAINGYSCVWIASTSFIIHKNHVLGVVTYATRQT